MRSTQNGRKLCRKLKDLEELIERQANGESVGVEYALKHFQNGDFHKNFDRLETKSSIVRFMRDPNGPVPFEEDASMMSVMNIENARHFDELMSTSQLPVVVFFYAPWCVDCQRSRSVIAEAARDVKG